MKRVLVRILLPAAVLLLAGACVKMGPDFRRPEPGFSVPASYQHGTPAVSGVWTEDRWWRVFGDPELNRLVQEALENNLDIKRAAARILELEAQFKQTRADRFPTVKVLGEVERERLLEHETDRFTLSLPASYEVDLWGRVARAEEAARADLLQAEQNRRTVAQSIAAQTISLYLQMEALERGIDIAERSIENYRHSLALVELRYERGLTSILDVRQARRVLARSESSLPALRQDLGVVQQRLAVLLGRYPETRPARQQPEDYFHRLADVPAGLPSELLLRRPDILEAEARLEALNARVGVAKASRFPTITLTGNFGYSSDELDRLFTPEAEIWNLALGIIRPVFDAGRLKAGQRAAEARYEQGMIEYAQTVLGAFDEVEESLLTRKEQLQRRERLLLFLEEARATQAVAESRYERGLVDYLTVLEAQQTRFLAEQDVVDVEFTILNNRVTLHRALGGGWGEPASAESEQRMGARES